MSGDFPHKRSDLLRPENPLLDEEGKNRFADEDQAPVTTTDDDNPYHSTADAGVTYRPDDFDSHLPHRGRMVLLLGATGFAVSCVAALAIVYLGPFGAISLALSLPAWLLGNADLSAMRAGAVDPAGRGMTRTGMILGIIGTFIGVMIPILFFAWLWFDGGY